MSNIRTFFTQEGNIPFYEFLTSLQGRGKKISKAKTMMQWINLIQNNSFVNRQQLLKLHSFSFSTSTIESCGRQADKRVLNLEILKLYTRKIFKFSWCLTNIQCYYSFTNAYFR